MLQGQTARRRWMILGRAVLAVALLGGCRDRESTAPAPVPRATEVVRQALNASPKVSDFLLEASNSIAFRTASSATLVTGGDVGARGTGSGPFLSGTRAIDVSSNVTIEATHNLIASSIHLASGAHVGDVQTSQLVADTGSTRGGLSALVPLPALLPTQAVSPGTANLNVGTGGTLTAAPGHFAKITVGTSGTLRLAAGDYEVAEVSLGSSGRIEALGPIQLRVAGRWTSGTSAFVGPAAGVTLRARDLRIEVS